MNIEKLDEHLRAKDVVQKCKLISLAFDNFHDENGLECLNIYEYRHSCKEYIEFKTKNIGFRCTYKYENLINEKITNENVIMPSAVGSFSSYILNNDSSFVVFIGKYDGKYLFLDIVNYLFFFVGDDFLKIYLKELLLYLGKSLFDNDFIKIKELLLDTPVELFECYDIEKEDS